MKKLKLALVGCWHVHGFDFAKKAAARPDCAMIAVCDGPPQWGETLGCRLEPDYGRLLGNPELDGIILACSTREHEDRIVRAAAAGKHVFVEKSLAVSDRSAYAIRDAVKAGGIHFTMSDPAMKAPQMLAKRMIASGQLGRITNIRMRTVHGGSNRGETPYQFYNRGESGGGALIDMGCKAVHVLYQLLGRPTGVCAMTRSYTELGKTEGAEENAVAIYRFSDGAIGTAETGWCSERYQLAMDVYGTQGCLCQRDDQVSYRLNGGEWVSVPPEELPPALDYPLTYWLESILNDTPNDLYGIDEAVALTEMITAAYRAAQRWEPVGSGVQDRPPFDRKQEPGRENI